MSHILTKPYPCVTILSSSLLGTPISEKRLYSFRATNDTAANVYLWVFDAPAATASPVGQTLIDTYKVRVGEIIMVSSAVLGADGMPFTNGICFAWSTGGAAFVAPAVATSLSFGVYVVRGT